jgi:hypothetical protein
VDLGLSSYPTSSVETSTLGMDRTISTSLPLISEMQVDKIANIPQKNLIQIHEDLENLQHQVILENISTTTIPTIESIHHMLEREGGTKLMRNIMQIFDKNVPPSDSQTKYNIKSQG